MTADLLISRMEDLAAFADQRGAAASRFLTPAQREQVSQYFSNRKDVRLGFDGGFEGAERTRAVFLNPEWGTCDRETLIAAFKIEYRQKDTVGHRDILGSLLGLGIERDTIGDIDAKHVPAVFVCLSEIGDFISENLTKIGRVGIQVTRINPEVLPAKAEIMEVKNVTVASMRLDAVVSAAYGVSRTEASRLITIGLIRYNHVVCQQQTKVVTEGAILSARGHGRAKIIEVCGTSRKGRMIIKIGVHG